MKNRRTAWHRLVVAVLAVLASATAHGFTCSAIPTTLNGSPTPVAGGSGNLSIGNNSTLSTTSTACSTPNGTTCTNAAGSDTTLSQGTGVGPPAQTLPAFQPTTFPAVGSTDTSVSHNGTLASGSYKKVNTAGTVTFSGGSYYIDELVADKSGGNNPLLKMAAGDYFIDKFDGKNNLTLQVTSGPVRIFVKTSWSVGNDATINAAGSPADFQLFAYDGASIQFGNNASNSSVDFKGLIYAPGTSTSIQMGNNNVIQGAVLGGGSVSLGNNTGIVFDASTQAAIDSINSCSLSGNWRFDDATWTAGATITDSSGNNLHATLNGAASATTAKVCNGGVLTPAASNYLTVPDSAKLDLSGGGTIMLWIKPTTTVIRWLFGKGTDFYAYLAVGKLYVGWGGSAPIPVNKVISASTIATNVWTHIAIRFDDAAGKVHIHLNGNTTPDASATTPISIARSASSLMIGTNTYLNTSSFWFSGMMDEMKIFRGLPLTAAEINEIYTAEAAGKNFDGSTRNCTGGPHHLEIQGSASGATCSPTTLTIKACSDAGCSGTYTGGVSGTLTATGTPTVNWDGSSGGASGAGFAIASGSETVEKFVQVTTPGSVVFGIAATPAPAPAAAATCNFGSPSCTFTAADSAFLFNRTFNPVTARFEPIDIPAHVAETTQSFKLSAVKKDDNSLACVPAFKNQSVAVTFRCTYVNPADGTLPVRIIGNTTGAAETSLNASNNASAKCDGSGAAVSVLFDNAGESDTTQQPQNLRMTYADVGRVSLSATAPTTGTASGLSMTGSTSFVAAPAAFTFSAYPLPPTLIKAGNAFSARVTARNSAGAATPNFGQENTPKEGVTLGWSRFQPTGAAASDGVFSGTVGDFANGFADGTDLMWSEVGKGDLTATLASGSYLGSGLTASGTTGSTGAVGERFVPDHFDTVVTQGCAGGGFTYSGQPFTVAVSAKNASGGLTQNYDGTAGTSPNFAKAVTLSDANSVSGGSLAPTAVAASVFASGTASATPSFTFTRSTPDKAPGQIKLRAADTDSVSSASPLAPMLPVEGTATIRIGRLQVANAFGSKTPLELAVQAQYWTGNSWLLNAEDSCTTIPTSAIVLSNYRDSKGAVAAWTTTPSSSGTLSGGRGTITLGAPSGGATGSVDLALNLGNSGASQSCLGSPGGTAASLPWLRGRYGNCAASTTYSADPSASASFGVFPGESRKAVHTRELF